MDRHMAGWMDGWMSHCATESAVILRLTLGWSTVKLTTFQFARTTEKCYHVIKAAKSNTWRRIFDAEDVVALVSLQPPSCSWSCCPVLTAAAAANPSIRPPGCSPYTLCERWVRQDRRQLLRALWALPWWCGPGSAAVGLIPRHPKVPRKQELHLSNAPSPKDGELQAEKRSIETKWEWKF